MQSAPAQGELNILSEFESCNLGDSRRLGRAKSIAAAIAQNPGKSLPQALGTVSAREGAYRLLENSAVSFDELVAGHTKATSERAAGLERVLVLHDTSRMKFSTPRAGMGRIGGKNSSPGFFLHASLAVGPGEQRDPLGLLAVEVMTRTRQTKSMRKQSGANEMERWHSGVRQAEQRLGGNCRAVHIMDREGDSYELLSHLFDNEVDFVIRACHDRNGPLGKLFDQARSAPIEATRKVHLSSRGEREPPKARQIYPARHERTADFEIRACAAEITRSGYLDGRCDLPMTLTVNVVNVSEHSTPAGEPTVEWTLLTSLPIGTPEDVLKIVDAYRSRWVIEEFFKSLKTGCGYEKLQLESYDSLLRALAIYLPVAWLLLRLRYLAGVCFETPAIEVLTETQVEVLRALAPGGLPEKPTLRQALLAVAALGGHIKNNGEPGWLVLGRGLQDLMLMERTWNACRAQQKCDQS